MCRQIPDPDPDPVGYAQGKRQWLKHTANPNAEVGVLSNAASFLEVAQWNLSLQRQIGNDWLVSASYLGTETSHMWTLQQMNPAVFMGLGACTIAGVQYAICSTTSNNDQRRRLNLAYPLYGKYYGDVPRIAAEGNASYNALLFSVQRRAARSVTLNANYTWSHCISDHPQPQQTAFGTNGNVGWTNGDRRSDRGNSSQSSADRRHLFNLSAVAATPGFANPALRVVASNWRFSPIVKILAGDAMTIVTTLDRALTGMFIPGVGSSGIGTVAGQRGNQVLGDPYGDGTQGTFSVPQRSRRPHWEHSGTWAWAV